VCFRVCVLTLDVFVLAPRELGFIHFSGSWRLVVGACGQCLLMLLRVEREYTWAERGSALKTVEVNLLIYSSCIIPEQP